ncbi:unnamed protein product, partial [Ectocarpus sp. 12 AP-2014]
LKLKIGTKTKLVNRARYRKSFFQEIVGLTAHLLDKHKATQYLSFSASFAALHTAAAALCYHQPHVRREQHQRSSETNSIIACETFPFLSSSERSGGGDQVPGTHHHKQQQQQPHAMTINKQPPRETPAIQRELIQNEGRDANGRRPPSAPGPTGPPDTTNAERDSRMYALRRHRPSSAGVFFRQHHKKKKKRNNIYHTSGRDHGTDCSFPTSYHVNS